jgi:hypothetical protein
VRRQGGRHNEVDLPDISEHQFQRSSAVGFISVGFDFKLEILLLRIKKRELLRVGQKNVYVTTFAMIDLQHHRCAATERPLDDDLF